MKPEDYETDFNFSDEEAVLKHALRNEVRGRNIYVQYANTVKNPLARRVFSFLADEELKHISDIKKYVKYLHEDVDFDVQWEIEKNPPGKIKEWFGVALKNLDRQVEPTDDDNKSRDMAMQIEKAAYEYYKRAAMKTKSPLLRKFFKWLLEQEQQHYMLIRNAFEYANNPDSWYAEEEHWLLEG